MKFVVFGPDGEAVRAGTCPDGKEQAQAKDGETAVAWPPENGAPQQWTLQNGELKRK